MRRLQPQDLVDLGRADLTAFTRWPLGMRGDYDLWWCQKDWQRRIQEAYFAKLKEAALPLDHPDRGKARHLCILAPSEHGKTTAMSVPFALWLLARNRNLRIIIAGSKDDLAGNVGQGMDRHFANKSEELGQFGLLRGYPWNSLEKFVRRENDNLIHPSILCVGPETEFQGKRADVIIMTDIATFKNQRSPEARQKLSDWINQTLFPRLEPNGFVLAEGHHVHFEDFYTELEEDADWKVEKFKAILSEPDDSTNGRASVLAPEQWTYKQLAAKREKKPALFQLMFQNLPVEIRGLVNREICERAFDRSRPLLYTLPKDVRDVYDKIEMGVDPAFSIKRWSAFSACWVRGVTKSGQKDMLSGWRLRLLPHQLRAKIIATIMTFRPDDVFIEANAAQIFLVEDVRKALGGLATVVKPVWTLGGTTDDTVEEAVSEQVTLIETGQQTFPYSGQPAQELTEQYMTELVNFPTGRFTDLMMAAQIMERGHKKIANMERRTIRFAGIARSVSGYRRGVSNVNIESIRRAAQGPLPL